MVRFIALLPMFVLLNGCGASSSSTSAQTPIDTPTPPSSTPPQDNSASCSYQPISVINAFASEEDERYVSSLAVDNDSAYTSRWQSTGTGNTLTLELEAEEQVGSLQIKWYQSEIRTYRFTIETSLDGNSWQSQQSNIDSNPQLAGFELYALPTLVNARFVRITGFGNNENNDNAIVEVDVFNCAEGDGEISSTTTDSIGIDLQDWYLSIPTDDDNSGTADNISESRLANGFTHSEYFYVSKDGALVMRSPTVGFKTSTNTNYVRVELREMLRRGNTDISTQGVNKNNWVLSSATQSNQDKSGGVDGRLHVSMSVNQVTTTGENYQIGRVIIGQIHANDDEPVRLYYRKLPNNNLGSIYFAHERRANVSDGTDKEEIWIEMIGSRESNAPNPTDGIALNERFSYTIDTQGNTLNVTISRDGKSDVTRSVNMENSGYDEEDQYLYFKVGVYHVNNSAEEGESAVASFYAIDNEHEGYQPR